MTSSNDQVNTWPDQTGLSVSQPKSTKKIQTFTKFYWKTTKIIQNMKNLPKSIIIHKNLHFFRVYKQLTIIEQKVKKFVE